MSTERERDFSSRFCLLCSSTPFTSWAPLVVEVVPAPPCPISLFLVGTSQPLLGVRVKVLGSAVALGCPGDVGGLARGAELIECAPRLWVFLGFGDSGVRVFVNVIVTVNSSPAK